MNESTQTFGIFVSYDAYFQPVAEITIPRLMEYCHRHGYSLTVAQNPPVVRTLVWDRALTQIDGLRRYDWSIHWDCDALITNMTVKLEDIVADFPSDSLIVMTRDFQALNDGIVFSRGGSHALESIALWDKLWQMRDEVSSLAATHRWVLENPEQRHIWAAPQRAFNSYEYGIYGLKYPMGEWQQGDFVLHHPGTVNSKRVELLTAALERIVR